MGRPGRVPGTRELVIAGPTISSPTPLNQTKSKSSLSFTAGSSWPEAF